MSKKDTVSLRELIEKNACKEGILWFMKWFTNGVANEFGYHSNYEFDSKRIANRAKEERHPEYITWLKDHGYDVGDNSAEIKDIKEQMDKLQERLEKLEPVKKMCSTCKHGDGYSFNYPCIECHSYSKWQPK